MSAFVLFLYFPELPTSKSGATGGQDRGAAQPQHHTLCPDRITLSSFLFLFPPFFFCVRYFFALCCVFDLAFNVVRLAVNGAWLVWGISGMTRDTLLLQFSQVRATPIEDTPVPLCLPGLPLSPFLSLPLISFSHSFHVVLSTYQRQRDGHKRAY